MLARGPGYLSAAVLYENLVVESYARPPAAGMPVVAIYPREGTFWCDHPYSILDAEWVGAPERQAAETLLAFLRARPAQERALALGFRPADPAIPVAAPVDAAHGADPKQPQTLLDVPDAATLAKLLASGNRTSARPTWSWCSTSRAACGAAAGRSQAGRPFVHRAPAAQRRGDAAVLRHPGLPAVRAVEGGREEGRAARRASTTRSPRAGPRFTRPCRRLRRGRVRVARAPGRTTPWWP